MSKVKFKETFEAKATSKSTEYHRSADGTVHSVTKEESREFKTSRDSSQDGGKWVSHVGKAVEGMGNVAKALTK